MWLKTWLDQTFFQHAPWGVVGYFLLSFFVPFLVILVLGLTYTNSMSDGSSKRWAVFKVFATILDIQPWVNTPPNPDTSWLDFIPRYRNPLPSKEEIRKQMREDDQAMVVVRIATILGFLGLILGTIYFFFH